jgi:hypothetical protein
MSENQMEVFEQVADMIIEEDIMGGPKSPAFIELLSLQFTRAEAKLALQIRTTGATLDQLVQKTGMKKNELQKTLHMCHRMQTGFHLPDTAPYRGVAHGLGEIHMEPWFDRLMKGRVRPPCSSRMTGTSSSIWPI